MATRFAKQFCCSTLVLAAVACGAPGTPPGSHLPAAEPETYPVEFDRPVAVGQRYAVTLQVGRTESVRVFSGQDLVVEQEERAGLQFEGVIRILEVDAQGLSLRREYTVARLSAEDGTGETELVAPGTTLVVQTRPQVEVTVGSQQAPPAVTGAVAMLLSYGVLDTIDDLLFRPPEPQAIGAQWETRLTAAEVFEGRGLSVGEDSIRGRVNLLDLREIDGEPCLEVSAVLSARPTAVPGAPPAAVVHEALVESRFSGLLPLDPSKPRYRQTMQFTSYADLVVTGEADYDRLRVDSTSDAQGSARLLD